MQPETELAQLVYDFHPARNFYFLPSKLPFLPLTSINQLADLMGVCEDPIEISVDSNAKCYQI